MPDLNEPTLSLNLKLQLDAAYESFSDLHIDPNYRVLFFSRKRRKYQIAAVGLSNKIATVTSVGFSEWSSHELPRFELAIHLPGELPREWAYQLLHDIVEGWLDDPDAVTRGAYLPVHFFFNSAGQLDCVSTSSSTECLGKAASDKIGFYLWPSINIRDVFEVCESSFFLMAAVLVNKVEEELADLTSPPHLILLFKMCKIDTTSDPHRPCVTTSAYFESAWNIVKSLSHDEAFDMLYAE